ncbi:MAG: type II toxin-antitoxin system Phd/YefM family antitoxin [Desulfamplus sp.]|nr:type II toxin-antitoxin system Phd/YefM family antitoxin [Desulfamplus sp.]
MLALHPEFLTKDGHKVFAVLPYEEFCRIQNALIDFEDLIELRQAKAQESTASTYSLEEVKTLLSIDQS